MKNKGILGIILCIVLSTVTIAVYANGSDIEIEIDVKPLSCPQSINPNNRGKIPVAIITTETFDALTVNPPTVRFAGAAPLRWSSEDYDGDGDIDLILKFKTQECILPTTPGYHQVFLDGLTMGGVYIWDYDWVHIV